MPEQPNDYLAQRIFDKLRGGVKSAKCGVADWRQKRGRESLEADLARAIETANGHRSRGEARGAKVFLSLEKDTDQKISKFCSKWGVSEDVIRAQAPALRDLHLLTIPETVVPGPIKAIGALIGVVITLALLAAGSGAFQAIHHWVYQHLSH